MDLETAALIKTTLDLLHGSKTGVSQEFDQQIACFLAVVAGNNNIPAIQEVVVLEREEIASAITDLIKANFVRLDAEAGFITNGFPSLSELSDLDLILLAGVLAGDYTAKLTPQGTLSYKISVEGIRKAEQMLQQK